MFETVFGKWSRELGGRTALPPIPPQGGGGLSRCIVGAGAVQVGHSPGVMPLPQAGLRELTADSPDHGVSWGPSEPGGTAWASGGPALGFPSPCALGQTVGAACSLDSTVCK